MKLLKISTLAALGIASAISASAATNLLQSVSVSFFAYTQGPNITSSTGTNYTVDKGFFGTKSLIALLSSNGYKSGDVLARSTPVTYTAITNTNLVAISNVVLVVSNNSTSLESVSNYLTLGSASPVFIGATNYTFSTNTETISGKTVAISNSVFYGTNGSIFIGTNTTVASSTFTNSAGYVIGTSNVFTINSLSNSPGEATNLGTASWVIYNKKSTPETTPISTNVYFDIHTDDVYDATNLAYIHGETVGKNGIIKFGTTDEIRTLIFTNATMSVKLVGFSNGHRVPISLGGGVEVYSADYNWTGSGSGLTNSVPVVLDGSISEQYFDLLK